MPAPTGPAWQEHFDRWRKRYRFTPGELDAAWDDAWRIYQAELEARGFSQRRLENLWSAPGKKPSAEKPYDAQDELAKLEQRRRDLVIRILGALRLGGGEAPAMEV